MQAINSSKTSVTACNKQEEHDPQRHRRDSLEHKLTIDSSHNFDLQRVHSQYVQVSHNFEILLLHLVSEIKYNSHK